MEKKRYKNGGGEVGGMYGVAFLGAAFYYLQNADTFSAGALGLLKAIFWPAFLIHKLYLFLGM